MSFTYDKLAEFDDKMMELCPSLTVRTRSDIVSWLRAALDEARHQGWIERDQESATEHEIDRETYQEGFQAGLLRAVFVLRGHSTQKTDEIADFLEKEAS